MGIGLLIPPARRAIVLTAGDIQGEKLGVFYAAYRIADVRLPF